MPSSSPAVAPPPIQPSASGGDGGEDEIEYESEYEEIEEEIEVEEEVEVEQEVEEGAVDRKEKDADGFEIGDDLTPVRAGNNPNEMDQDMELDEEYLNSCSLTTGTSVANPQLDVTTNQEFNAGYLPSKPGDGGEKMDLYINGTITSTETNAKASFDGNLEANKTFSREANATITTVDACMQKENRIESVVAKPLQTTDEDIEVSKQMPPRTSVPSIRPRDSSYGAENDGENKRPRVVCEFYAKGWCIKGKSCRFLHIKEGLDVAGKKITACSGAHMPPPQSSDDTLNCQIEKSVVHKHDSIDGALEQLGKMPIGQYSDGFGRHTSPLVKFNSIDMNRGPHGNISAVPSDKYTKSSFFPFGIDETVSKKKEFNPHGLNLSYYSRPPVPFGLSSWTIDALGTKNTFERNREYRASVSSSFRRSTSPFSGSNSGCLSESNNVKNIQPTRYKTKISHGGWEPSAPFCPSHVITQNLLLKEILYDPILDSVEQTGAKDWPYEFSFSDPGISVNNRFKSNKLQEKNLLDDIHVEDTRKASRLSCSGDNGLTHDKLRHQKELQMDGFGQNDENDVDSKRDECVQNESKALKYFHAALVEYVKELVKPSWREGLMSKDAHKIIVKKAVDKVLSTLQPHQIPNTAESIKSYLSVSEAKLSKLVEGYIEKYGKS